VKLKLSDITVDHAMQIRAGMDEPTVSRYEELIAEGRDLGELTVWEVDGAHILLDGFHRLTALQRVGAVDAACAPFCGTKAEALICACLKNSQHGLHLSSADRRAAIKALVEAQSDLSSSAIAEAVGCSDHTVKAVRDTLGAGSQSARVKGKDGKNYPAKMKRETRGEPDEKDDDENGEPPSDPGLGGEHLSPEALAKDGLAQRISKALALQLMDRIIEDFSAATMNDSAARALTVKAWIKSL
jgi:hypothetical protein